MACWRKTPSSAVRTSSCAKSFKATGRYQGLDDARQAIVFVTLGKADASSRKNGIRLQPVHLESMPTTRAPKRKRRYDLLAAPERVAEAPASASAKKTSGAQPVLSRRMKLECHSQGICFGNRQRRARHPWRTWHNAKSKRHAILTPTSFSQTVIRHMGQSTDMRQQPASVRLRSRC